MQQNLEEKDRTVAKNMEKQDVPLEYMEIEDIIDRKVDGKTHNFMYLVKFKATGEEMWLPGHNFLQPVRYNRRKSVKPKETQFAKLDMIVEDNALTSKKCLRGNCQVTMKQTS